MKKLDFTLPLLALIFLAAAITSLPFNSKNSQIAKAVEYQNERYGMSNAPKWVVNVDQFVINENGTFFAGMRVESDLSENDQAELFYKKEEIVIRVADNNRCSIITGDNNEF